MTTAEHKVTVVEGGEENARAYWRRNVRLIWLLLAIWALISFGAAVVLSRTLYGINIGQAPLSFWIAQQGAIYVFVILIFVYARLMDGLDARFGVHEDLE